MPAISSGRIWCPWVGRGGGQVLSRWASWCWPKPTSTPASLGWLKESIRRKAGCQPRRQEAHPCHHRRSRGRDHRDVAARRQLGRVRRKASSGVMWLAAMGLVSLLGRIRAGRTGYAAPCRRWTACPGRVPRPERCLPGVRSRVAPLVVQRLPSRLDDRSPQRRYAFVVMPFGPEDLQVVTRSSLSPRLKPGATSSASEAMTSADRMWSWTTSVRQLARPTVANLTPGTRTSSRAVAVPRARPPHRESPDTTRFLPRASTKSVSRTRSTSPCCSSHSRSTKCRSI
jgi:hypothetical protein